MKAVDLTGNRFETLTAIRKTDKRTSNGKIIWECLCDCGKIHYSSVDTLKGGKVKSCGRLSKPDLTGQKFGKLTVIKDTGKRKNNRLKIWKCICVFYCNCIYLFLIKTTYCICKILNTNSSSFV